MIAMWQSDRELVRLHRAESSDLSRTTYARDRAMSCARLRGGCRQLTTDLRTVR